MADAVALEQEKNRMQESELIRLRTENSQLRQQLASAQQQLAALHAVLQQQQQQMAWAAQQGGGPAAHPQQMARPPAHPQMRMAAPAQMAAAPPRPQFPPSPLQAQPKPAKPQDPFGALFAQAVAPPAPAAAAPAGKTPLKIGIRVSGANWEAYNAKHNVEQLIAEITGAMIRAEADSPVKFMHDYLAKTYPETVAAN